MEDGEQVELDLDGSIVENSDSPKIDPILTTNFSAPKTPLFATSQDIEELNILLKETSSHFSTPANTYKVHANAAKFERLLDEKYGRFRPFIESHPQVEVFIKNISRKYAMGAFSPFKKSVPINKTTSIMVSANNKSEIKIWKINNTKPLMV